VIEKKTGEVREEVGAGVTSVLSERADAAQLLALVRGQWDITNKYTWVRDVTCNEDRSQVRPRSWRRPLSLDDTPETQRLDSCKG
jgi:predicted transposase YbfD/YdcC